uniref:Uncharacterized protein n=1 Tax=Romanomermis culicivorax TaxID=13658 RepID=A0A915JDW1_ROMCU
MSMGLQESVRVYNMHRDASIEKHVEISLLTSANKMTFDFDSGDLYIAAFPILHEALSLKIYSALGRTSSHILRIKLQDKEVRQWVINEMLASSGSMISGSEVAVYYHSLLIVGSLGGKLLICEAPITETY